METPMVSLFILAILLTACSFTELSIDKTEQSNILEENNSQLNSETAKEENSSEQQTLSQQNALKEEIPTSKADADVTFVKAKNDGSSWTFEVTIIHPDLGWDDYADGWDVVLPNGEVIIPSSQDAFTRLLTHPHENKIPFTRSQSGIVIPKDVVQVTVRAHDIIDGFGGKEITVDLAKKSGEGFEVR